MRSPFSERTSEEIAIARYFQYHVRKDDQPKPLAAFMLHIVDTRKEPKRRKVQSSDREPFNWLPKLSYFDNNFFLVATGLLISANYSKGIARFFITLLFSLFLT